MRNASLSEWIANSAASARIYPHFLVGPAASYLYASPAGLLPCPTLAIAIGFALLGNGLGSRPWSLTLAAVGLFYGLFGVFRLGVYLDIALVGGAIALGFEAGVRALGVHVRIDAPPVHVD